MTDDESKRVDVHVRQGQADAAGPGRDDGPVEGGAAARVRRQADRHQLRPGVPDRHAARCCRPDAALTLELIDGDSPALFRSGARLLVPGDAADVMQRSVSQWLTGLVRAGWLSTDRSSTRSHDATDDEPETGRSRWARSSAGCSPPRGWGRRQDRLHLEQAWAEAAGPDVRRAHARRRPAARRAGGGGRQRRAVAGAGPLPQAPAAGAAARAGCPARRSPTCASARASSR